VNEPYVAWSACAHGLSADRVQLRPDDAHGALYVELDDYMSIRIQVRPHPYADAEQHGGELERDRQGLLRLAEVARQAAEEIGQLQQDGAPKPPGFDCDCGRRLPWPSRVQDETCPDCGAVWEHDGVDLGAGARIKHLGRLPGEPLQDDAAAVVARAIETGTPVIVIDDEAEPEPVQVIEFTSDSRAGGVQPCTRPEEHDDDGLVAARLVSDVHVLCDTAAHHDQGGAR
jgi:hypothetical protein